MTSKHTHSHEGKKTTLVSYIMDMSGSMDVVRDATISGYNEYTNSLKKDTEYEYHFGLIRFNSQEMRVDSPVEVLLVEELDHASYIPGFSTPLIDATWKAIKRAEVDERKLDNPRVLIVIQTDGIENASTHSTSELETLIKSKQDKGWEFLFLGANQDAWHQAGQFGIQRQNTISYDNVPKHVKHIFSAAAGATRGYAEAGSEGAQGALDVDIGSSRNIREGSN